MRARGAQSLSDIAEETLLPAEQREEARRHAIDAGGEIAQFVFSRFGERLIEAAFRDVLRGVAHLRDGSRKSANEGQPAGDEDEDHGAGDGEPRFVVEEERRSRRSSPRTGAGYRNPTINAESRRGMRAPAQ